MKAALYNQAYSYQNREWVTTYITNLPIEKMTKEVEKEVVDTIKTRFKGKSVQLDTLRLERNGLTKFWQFTFLSLEEITLFQIDDNH